MDTSLSRTNDDPAVVDPQMTSGDWSEDHRSDEDNEIVSHDSAKEIEDTTGVYQRLVEGGAPVITKGAPITQHSASADEVARVIVKSERIAGEQGTFFSYICEVVQPLIAKSISEIRGFVTEAALSKVVARVTALEGQRRDRNEISLLRSELLAEIAARELLEEQVKSLSRDLSHYLSGAREIYNSFDNERKVEEDPRIKDLLRRAEEAEKGRDEALKRESTRKSSGGIGDSSRPAPVTKPAAGPRRIVRAPASTVAEFKNRFSPALDMREAVLRFSAGER